jgi:hypothetical protein
VAPLGGGRYRLTWRVPAGARAYQIKYADRPIVEWLGFDQLTRRYEFDPAGFVAFFAASNVDGEPSPGAAGSTQEVVISGLDPARPWHFAIRYELAP